MGESQRNMYVIGKKMIDGSFTWDDQKQSKVTGRIRQRLAYFAELGDASRGNPLNYENVSVLIETGVVRVYESARLPLIALQAETVA